MGMYPSLELEKDVRAFCEAEIKKAEDKINGEALESRFQLAAKKNWKSIINFLLSAEPCPLREETVLRFCQDESRKKTLGNMNEEALRKSYALADKNDWGLVKNFLLTQKLVEKADLPFTRPRR